jgi:hypothetical protein
MDAHRSGTAALSLVLVGVMALGTTLLNILLPACLCFLCWQAQDTSRRCLLADFRYRGHRRHGIASGRSERLIGFSNVADALESWRG